MTGGPGLGLPQLVLRIKEVITHTGNDALASRPTWLEEYCVVVQGALEHWRNLSVVHRLCDGGSLSPSFALGLGNVVEFGPCERADVPSAQRIPILLINDFAYCIWETTGINAIHSDLGDRILTDQRFSSRFMVDIEREAGQIPLLRFLGYNGPSEKGKSAKA